MTTVRQFCCMDLLRSSSVHLDHFVYTDTMSFYLRYMAKWPTFSKVAVSPSNRIMGYIIGQAITSSAPPKGTYWSGHVTAVAVDPEYRRIKVATNLVRIFEDSHEKNQEAYYTNLDVRVSNFAAIRLFLKLGYMLFRRLGQLYGPDQDAFEMRKFINTFPIPDESQAEKYAALFDLYTEGDHVRYCMRPLYLWGGERTPIPHVSLKE